jgi:hypothetical protein
LPQPSGLLAVTVTLLSQSPRLTNEARQSNAPSDLRLRCLAVLYPLPFKLVANHSAKALAAALTGSSTPGLLLPASGVGPSYR